MPGFSYDYRRPISPGAWWAVFLVSLMVLAQILSELYGGWRFDRARYDSGAWWQLFTSQWVHFGVTHAALNAACMVLMLVAFQGLVAAGVQRAALLGGHMGVAVVLGVDTTCSYYAGASGALHGLLAGSALAFIMGPPLTLNHRAGSRWLGVGLLGFLTLKLCLQPGFSASIAALAIGSVPVYFPSHVAGTLGGLLAVMLYRAFFTP